MTQEERIQKDAKYWLELNQDFIEEWGEQAAEYMVEEAPPGDLTIETAQRFIDEWKNA